MEQYEQNCDETTNNYEAGVQRGAETHSRAARRAAPHGDRSAIHIIAVFPLFC